MERFELRQSVSSCSACPDDTGQPVSVSFGHGVKTIRLRCPVCEREWQVVEPSPRGSWFDLLPR
jgi:formate dehydrogenase maturation protein FdhE